MAKLRRTRCDWLSQRVRHVRLAPSDYFCGLVEQFEVQLKQYRQQIEDLETHLTTQSSVSQMTPQDLSVAMQKCNIPLSIF